MKESKHDRNDRTNLKITVGCHFMFTVSLGVFFE